MPANLAEYLAEMWEHFGRQLKAWRQAQQLTQERLAELAGVHAVTISRLERGNEKPKLATLEAIAKALNHSLNDVLAAIPPQPARSPDEHRPIVHVLDEEFSQIEAIRGLLRGVPTEIRDEVLHETVRIVHEHWQQGRGR